MIHFMYMCVCVIFIEIFTRYNIHITKVLIQIAFKLSKITNPSTMVIKLSKIDINSTLMPS